MRHTLIAMLAGVSVAAATGLAGLPASAAVPSTAGDSSLAVTVRPVAPVAPPGSSAAAILGPLFNQERQSLAVREMAAQVQRDIGAALPGEDSLGSGTSITH